MRRFTVLIFLIVCGLLPALAADETTLLAAPQSTDVTTATDVSPQPSVPLSQESLAVSDSGFTNDTKLKVEITDDDIIRFDWWRENDLKYVMGLRITLTEGHGLIPGPTRLNKLMIYGDRVEPRYVGEADWSLSPRPWNTFVNPLDKSIGEIVLFGPPCARPGDLQRWYQYYTYSACCNLVGGGSVSDAIDNNLKVEDSL